MNLYTMLAARAAAGRPVRVGLIGAGKFGSMILSQARHIEGMHIVGVADLDVAKARASFARVGWSEDQYSAKSLGEAIKTGKTCIMDNAAALADPRFATLSERAQVFDELYVLLADEAARRTTADWMAFCDSADIPCMPVIALDDIQDDAHVRAVGLFEEAEHPLSGAYRVVRNPTLYSATDFQVRHHAPALGEHSRVILEEAGLTDAEIDAVLDPAA